MEKIEVLCLGVGQGSTSVTRGEPSSSFCIIINNEPEILIDCGFGVGHSCITNLSGNIPSCIYISHDHVDHSGDLAIVVQLRYQLFREKTRVLGNSQVLNMIRDHRLFEMKASGLQLEDFVEFIAPNQNGLISLGFGMKLLLLPSKHSLPCYGFLLQFGNEFLLGYTADSGFNDALYAQVTRAKVAIIDGRENGDDNHASFLEIEQYCANIKNCKIYVTHYEASEYQFKHQNINFLRIGDRFELSNH